MTGLLRVDVERMLAGILEFDGVGEAAVLGDFRLLAADGDERGGGIDPAGDGDAASSETS